MLHIASFQMGISIIFPLSAFTLPALPQLAPTMNIAIMPQAKEVKKTGASTFLMGHSIVRQ